MKRRGWMRILGKILPNFLRDYKGHWKLEQNQTGELEAERYNRLL